ncbi:TetR/AcrR family transcriptional regulator [Pseudactinotalea sp. Z1748]|uniref:TetR/AcrR family transcriptional regulator n=1 Tax=Pseudactinotalea sp. Z1748 TaxID=3413027 RepID=UPI003C7CFA2F
MPETRARTRPRRSEVRTAILDAAMEVFAAEGFDGASLNTIASVAGFTKGAVYSNFDSKDDLFLALIDRQVTRRSELVLQALTDVQGDQSTLAAAVGERLTHTIHADPQWQILFFEFCLRALRDEDVRTRFVQHRREVRAKVAETTETLRHRLGLTAMSAQSLTLLVMGLSNGLAIEEMVDPGVVPSTLISDMLTQMQPHPPALVAEIAQERQRQAAFRSERDAARADEQSLDVRQEQQDWDETLSDGLP